MKALPLALIVALTAAIGNAQNSPYLDPNFYSTRAPIVTMPTTTSPYLDPNYYDSTRPRVTIQSGTSTSPYLDPRYYQSNNTYVTLPSSSTRAPNQTSPYLDSNFYSTRAPVVTMPSTTSPYLDPDYYSTRPRVTIQNNNTTSPYIDPRYYQSNNTYVTLPDPLPRVPSIPSSDGAKVIWRSADGSKAAFDNGVMVDDTHHSVTWIAEGRKFRLHSGGRIEELPYSRPNSDFDTEARHEHDVSSLDTSRANRIVAVVTALDGAGLNIRSAPKQNGSAIVTTLHHGDHVFLEPGYVNNSDPPAPATWQRVASMSGYTGWIRADFLSNSGLAEDANRGGGD
jgi:hypothetical protein